MTHEHTSGSSVPALARHVGATVSRAVLAVVLASVLASALDAVVARIWHAAGASAAFSSLHPSAYIFLSVVGIIARTVGWCVICSRSRNPARALRAVVPVVLLLSSIPDLLVGVSKSLSGTTWGAVIGLMLTHLLVAAVAFAALRLLLSVPAALD